MVGRNEGRRPLLRPWSRWENNIKWILNKWDGRLQIGFMWLKQGVVTRYFENFVEIRVQKVRVIWRFRIELQCLGNGLCSVQLSTCSYTEYRDYIKQWFPIEETKISLRNLRTECVLYIGVVMLLAEGTVHHLLRGLIPTLTPSPTWWTAARSRTRLSQGDYPTLSE
jgi:hypothetical protein